MNDYRFEDLGFFQGLSDALNKISDTGNRAKVAAIKSGLRERGVAAILAVVCAAANEAPLLVAFCRLLRATNLSEGLVEELFVTAKNDSPSVFKEISTDIWGSREVFYRALPLLSREEVDRALLDYLQVRREAPRARKSFWAFF